MRRLPWVGPLALAVGLVLLSTSCNRVAADDKPGSKLELPKDLSEYKELRQGLFEATDFGVKLYNSNNIEACYRVYQGALLAARPQVERLPGFKEYINEGLRTAGRLEEDSFVKAAFKLRTVLDNVRKGLKTGELPDETKPLWVRLGREDGVGKIVDDFIAAAATDPAVNFTRSGTVQLDKVKLRSALVAQISSLTGGPHLYKKDMKTVHKDMNITGAEFDAAVGHLKKALIDNRVQPDDMNEILDAVKAMRNDIVAPPTRTVWGAMGGEPVVRKLVHDFVEAASKDKQIDFSRGGKYKVDDALLAKVETELVKQLSYLTDGPYRREKGAPEAYEGLNITADEFDAARIHLAKAFKDSKIPEVISFALQNAILEMRPSIIAGKPVEAKKPLWDRLEGEKGVELIVKTFVESAVKNKAVNLDRGGTLKLDDAAVMGKVKKSLAAYLADVAEGPLPKDYVEIRAFDKGVKLTDAEFDARKEEFKKALEKSGGKDDLVKEFVEAIEKTRKKVVETKTTEPPGDKPKVAEATGKVMVEDKLLGSGKITFVAPDQEPVSGEIKDGMYKVKGLKTGVKYKIVIESSDKTVDPRYTTSSTTPLAYTFKDKAMEELDWKLTK